MYFKQKEDSRTSVKTRGKLSTRTKGTNQKETIKNQRKKRQAHGKDEESSGDGSGFFFAENYRQGFDIIDNVSLIVDYAFGASRPLFERKAMDSNSKILTSTKLTAIRLP